MPVMKAGPDYAQLEEVRDQGGYPSNEQMVEALASLDLIDEDERPLDKVPPAISRLLNSRVDSLTEDEAKAALKEVLRDRGLTPED